MAFIEYELTSQALCMGERIKVGIFRPCVKTIPYSQITGALRNKFGLSDLYAVGYLVEDRDCNVADYFIYSPRDRVLDTSKIPLQVEYLSNVKGKVLVVKNTLTEGLPDDFTVALGALRSKGFGMCRMRRLKLLGDGDEEMQPPKRPEHHKDYVLNVRLPERPQIAKELFKIQNVFKPVYGYLFEPDKERPYTGQYVRALFEGSIVIGPKILLKKRPLYG